MIKPGELQKRARETGVRDTQIEKDYILTWLLKGISVHPRLSKVLAFKGGTVLKKVYFESYRFSEDLDFSLLDDSLTNETIFSDFQEVFDYIAQEANIALQIGQDNEHESGSINFYTIYAGPLGGKVGSRQVKIDITRNEILEFEPQEKPVFIHYSDFEDFNVLSYSLSEVIIEKMCALMGRTQPRDLYDLWYLFEYDKMDIKHTWPEFERKAKNKGHEPADFAKKVQSKFNSFKGRWQGSLANQIQDLPDFNTVTRELNKHFRRVA